MVQNAAFLSTRRSSLFGRTSKSDQNWPSYGHLKTGQKWLRGQFFAIKYLCIFKDQQLLFVMNMLVMLYFEMKKSANQFHEKPILNPPTFLTILEKAKNGILLGIIEWTTRPLFPVLNCPILTQFGHSTPKIIISLKGIQYEFYCSDLHSSATLCHLTHVQC